MCVTNKKINFLSKGEIGIKNPLHKQSERPACASKQEGVVLAIIHYTVNEIIYIVHLAS